MILEYEYFVNKLNEKLFEGSSKDLLEKIVSNPDRYVGIFRPTKPKTKLIQNITQSHEIKFGDALENIFEDYFRKLRFDILPKRLSEQETSDNKVYSIDQLFKKNNTIYLIEQKVRDDHDSTKKVGQFNNFEKKYFEVSRRYSNNEIIPIMWFIDDSLRKNRNYYNNEMNRMAEDYGCSPKLYYGEELFSRNEYGIQDIPYEMWSEINEYLILWKETLPDMPEVNFDINSEEVYEEIKDLSPAIYRKLFENEDILEQILPIIFTTGKVLRKLKKYFYSKKDKKIYETLYEKVNEYICTNFKDENDRHLRVAEESEEYIINN